MNKYKFFIYISLTCLLITSCGTVKEGFTNQKKESSDEFLVEKKSFSKNNFLKLSIGKKKHIKIKLV